VGLVQREIERAGFSTITLSSIPELTRSAGVPRLAALEFPLGRPFGEPGDIATQTAILKAAISAIGQIREPGGVYQLPFTWHESPRQVRNKPPKAPPIARHLQRHPWHIRDFLKREIPEEYRWIEAENE
jgi:hypothetical protein